MTKKDYELVKVLNKEKVVFIKIGNFFTAFDADAYIVSYLLGYKMVNYKIGFPPASLEKTIDKLLTNKISSVVLQDDFETIQYESEENNYKLILQQSSEHCNTQIKLEEITNKIKHLVQIDNDNCNKIIDFLNHL